MLNNLAGREKDAIERAITLARAERPAYSGLYTFLEAVYIPRAEALQDLRIETLQIPREYAESRWQEGIPLINRWDFPIDAAAAEKVLDLTGKALPPENQPLLDACRAIKSAIPKDPEDRERFWASFLHHEMEPWEEWIQIDAPEGDLASILFMGRSAVRPSIEFGAAKLLESNPLIESWLKGYCPVCGSFPSLLYLEGEGERRAFCSWCATRWNLHRLQCPYCDNRYYESLGYLSVEAEPSNRIVYCNLCRFYFKQIDTRELAYPPYLPLEEWTTLHLDLLAQKSGWKQPPSPAPAIYG